MGKAALIQHATRSKHLLAMAATLKQPTIPVVKPQQQQDGLNTDDVLVAEMRWAAFVAENDLSHNIAVNCANLFASLFPDSNIAKRFSCSRTKLSYLISDGFQPVLHNELVEDLRASNFSLLIDESNKSFGNKYLHMLVKYVKDGAIVTKFFKAAYVKSGNAEEIAETINNSFSQDGIPWTNVLHVMSDSPNVMRGSRNGVIAIIKSKYAPNIIDVGGCSLHHVHNAASYATARLGEEVEAFAVDVYAFFKHRTGLVQEFRNVQSVLDIGERQILRFVSTRWLSMLPVVNRLLEQWDALVVFFETLKKKHPEVAKQDRTRRIMSNLSSPVIQAKLSFLSAALPRFDAFEKLFQSKDGKIHLLYLEMCELIKTVMVQFVKPDLLENVGTGAALQEIKYEERDNQLPDKSLCIGKDAEQILKQLSREEKKLFFLDVRSFFSVAVKKLIHYFPLGNKILQDVQFLHPSAQKEHVALSSVKRISSALSQLNQDVDVNGVENDWRRYAIEDFAVAKEKAEDDETAYWNCVLAAKYPGGEPKFPHLALAVRLSLSIAHGNADTERSFSRSSRIITKQRNLVGLQTLNGLLSLSSHFDNAGEHAHDMTLTESRLKAGREANATYTRRKAEERKKELEQKEKKKENADVRAFCESLQTKNKITEKEKVIEREKAGKKAMYQKIDFLLKEAQTYVKNADKSDKVIVEKEKEVESLKAKIAPKSESKHLKQKRKAPVEKRKPNEPCVKQAKITDFKEPCEPKAVTDFVEPNEPQQSDTYDSVKAAIGNLRVDKIRGDGNCYFRTISKCLYGNEEMHLDMRKKITDFLVANIATFRIYIDGDVEQHIKGMRKNGVWATQCEIFATASWLSRDIFVLTLQNGVYKWCLFPPKVVCNSSTAPSSCKCHLTICNTDACHYDRICTAKVGCNCNCSRPELC